MRLLASRLAFLSPHARFPTCHPLIASFRISCAISSKYYSTNTPLSPTTMTIPQLGPDWRYASGDASVPPFHTFAKPIVKSQQDDRDYRLIKLENGLQAMLIHDPKADKAAASMDVAVGHLFDPDDMPGLAHFCEHLLFMGTEQFPKENEYTEYLSKNNGSSNAYTGTSNTNYFFSVATAALPGALARFSAFFHSPLFSPSCTSRELNAVDSEHKKNHQNDMWRIFQLNKHLSKPGHPWSKFGSGNRESLSRVGRELRAKGLLKVNGANGVNGTNGANGSNGFATSPDGSLAATPIPSRVPSPTPSNGSGSGSDTEADGGAVGRETRRRLVDWWANHYCANRMRLCVIGKESLDDLSALVSQLFSPIPNRGLSALPMINDHPFGPNEISTLVAVHTVMSFHALEISFPLPYQPPFWRHNPGNFLAHFVGHEGPGSLHSYLKNKHYITALSAGPQPLARGFANFKVTLRLSKEGFENHREVALAVFKYLSLLRASPLAPWNQKEIQTIKATRFRFAEKRRPEDYAIWVAEQMAWPVPRDQVLSAPQLVEEWDAEDPMKEGGGEREVRDALEGLRVERGRSVLMARKEEFERIGYGSGEEWDHEPIYGTAYKVNKYDSDFIREANSTNDIPDLFLPGPNEFVPTNLEVDKRKIDEVGLMIAPPSSEIILTFSKPSRRPHLIRDTPLSTVWHKKDDQFWVPRAQVIIDIRNPLANESARNSVMTRLFADLVTDSLTEFAYDADLAGLNYNFSAHTSGVFATLHGYNCKLNILAKDVLERARTLVVNPERLNAKKQEIKRDWENFFLEQPFRISDYFARYLLTQRQWTLQEKLEEISSITPHELQTFISKLLSQVHLRTLVVGNMYKDEAIRLVEMAESILQATPLPSKDAVELALIPETGSNHVWSTAVPNPNEPNSSLTYYVHFGSTIDPRLRVLAALVIQIMSEPAFNVLRTREQLGYIVFCTPWSSTGDAETGMRIVIQSERVPTYLEERVEVFLDEMKTKLEGFSNEEFEQQKNGLEKRWREAVKNMSEETNRYWPHIDNGYLDFYRRSNDADLLRTITKEDILSFFMDNIHWSSATRAKVSVHLRSRKPRPKRVSQEALTAIEELLVQQGVVNPVQWKEDLPSDEDPSVDQVYAYLKGVLPAEGPNVAGLLTQIAKLVEEYPSAGDLEGAVRDGVVAIEDPKAFKATLRTSQPPKPIVEWGDLVPFSKY